ncbi:MAG: hypothetical protein LBF16_04720, partial [Pseudomonadales bacterium]|nr:hypothetical protein [Pseudomonadales bacterium]
KVDEIALLSAGDVGGIAFDTTLGTLVGVAGGKAVSFVGGNWVPLSPIADRVGNELAPLLKYFDAGIGAIQGFKAADEINAVMTAAEMSPAWKAGSMIAEVTLEPGTRVKMVISERQYQTLFGEKPEYGGFATFDDVPNQAFARNELAITSEMKSNTSYVIEVEITQPFNAQIGIVGPQELASGGASQLHFIIPPVQKMNVLKFIGGSEKALP